MANNILDSQKVKEAFEIIQDAFREKTGKKIKSIGNINFVTEDETDNSVSDGGFNFFNESLTVHPLNTLHCRRVGGHWVCTQ